VSERLRDYDAERPPALMVFEGCQKTIEMFSSIKVDENDSTVVDKKSPLKHWADVVAYACARASRGAGSIIMDQHEFDRTSREDVDTQQPRAAGGWGYGA
jgi:hypothetical protein